MSNYHYTPVTLINTVVTLSNGIIIDNGPTLTKCAQCNGMGLTAWMNPIYTDGTSAVSSCWHCGGRGYL